MESCKSGGSMDRRDNDLPSIANARETFPYVQIHFMKTINNSKGTENFLSMTDSKKRAFQKMIVYFWKTNLY